MEKNNLLFFTFLFMIIMLTSSSYFQFQLMRLPSNDHKINIDPIACQNESTINQDAQYKQICYEKDIAYVTNFMSNQQVYYISFDLTTPLSWIKSPSCVIQGTAYKCARKQQTFSHKFKEIKNNIVKKFHKKNKQDDTVNQDTIIQGASQIVRGKLQLSKSIHFYTRDSKVLNNFLDLIMLGLYLRGQKEHLLLQSTNFINATSISSNLNKLNDGAISMRFDSTSQNSFLNEIFSYVKARQKTICIYLGKNQSITIGDMTAKYTLSGYSSINWINMSDDQGFGKWPHINRIGLQDISQDSQNQSQYTIPAIFTLSSSYIGIPDNIINQVLIKSFKNLANCSINSKSLFLQCSYKNKKNGQKLTEKQLFFAFSQKNLMIPFSQLILSNSHNKLVFNIKKTYINKIILGQPIFKHYVLIFDYSKYQIGFGPKRQNFNEFFINVVSLIRFLCFIFVLGCSFIVCYEPCKKMSNVFLNYRKNGRGAEGLGLRQYKPIDENPYDEINKQVNDALQSTQKQVQGL